MKYNTIEENKDSVHFAKIKDDISAIKKEIRELDQYKTRLNERPGGAINIGDNNTILFRANSKNNQNEDIEFLDYLRNGKTRNDVNNTIGGSSYPVSNKVIKRIDDELLKSGSIYGNAKCISISGNSYEWIRYEEDILAHWDVEKTTPKSSSITKRTIVIKGVHLQVLFPSAVVYDQSYDMMGDLVSKSVCAFANAQETAFLIGDGINQPQGILSDSAKVQRMNIKIPTNGDDLIRHIKTLEQSLEDKYKRRAAFMVSLEFAAMLRDMKLSDGTPAWHKDITAKAPATIFGYPVIVNEYMSGLSSNDKNIPLVIFGDFDEAYTILENGGMTVLRDEITCKGSLTIYITKNIGGAVVNPKALRILVGNK